MNFKFKLDKYFSMLDSLNSSKFLIGIAMIIFNIGSKFLVIDMSKTQQQFFKNILIRRLTLFCIFFVATRDLVISLILTATFIIIAFNIFNEDSKYSVLSKNTFYDNVYTKEEYEMSKKIITEYEKENNHLKFCKNN